MTTRMNDILSRLELQSESIDAAIYKPARSTDKSLANDLNRIALEGNLYFEIQLTDEYGEQKNIPTQDTLENFSTEIIKFKKTNSSSELFFFSTGGLIQNIGSRRPPLIKSIHIAEDFTAFKSLSCHFKPWDLSTPEPEATEVSEELTSIDARRFVSDFTGLHVSVDHLFWVTPNLPEKADDTTEHWLTHATEKASVLLFSEVSNNDSGVALRLKGSRSLEFALAQNSTVLTPDQQRRIHSAIGWIFETPRDAETRHILLSQRLSNNEVKNSEDWLKFLARTISSSHIAAREDYKNHLLIKTGDLLKAVTDIRKTVSDETNKIIEKTQALSTNLLRDASIAFVIVALRQTLSTKNIMTPGSTSIFMLATIGWLMTSIFLTGYQNKLFIRTQMRFRNSWSKGLSSLIPKEELNKISRRPFKEAIHIYSSVKNIVNFAYATLILILLSVIVFW